MTVVGGESMLLERNEDRFLKRFPAVAVIVQSPSEQ